MPSSNLKMHTPNLVDSNIERLAELFPNCVTEKPKTDEQGKVIRDMNGEVVLERGIDFELLKQELSHSVIDGSQERYRLDWVGKREAIVTANSPIAKTLRPCREESVDFETTGNLFIEGDNLEALKLLQESYLGKVKTIYIDPPYNTGNDFIYNDDFAADTAEFFERSGQVDADGNRLVANTESNGRFHSDWLSMMYSRLKLARNLLADDGVLVVSLSDHEIHNLRKMSDEIFGETNFLADVIWNSTKSVTNTALISVSHTHNLVYFKSKEYFVKNRELFRLPDEGEGFSNPDNDPRGAWKADPFQVGGWRPNQQYDIVNPKTGKIYRPNLGSSWKNDYSKFQELIKDNRIVFGTTGEGSPQRKRFIWEAQERGKVAKTLWDDIETTTNGTQLLKNLFDNQMLFSNPKPISLIQRFLQLSTTNKNDIVLDFFAGSSTTAHAVMQLNAEDGGNRKFIMVQIPEATDSKSEAHKAGYPTIAEISKERIRRAGAKIRQDNTDKDLSNLDTGFRVLKIDTTNMNDIYYHPQDYSQDLLATLENNIKPDRSDEDLLFQFMLDTGVPLSLPIERTQLPSKSGGHTIYQVGGNSLIASLDYIDATMVNDIAALNPLKFITSERAIATDSDKTNIKERFKQLSPHTDVRFI